MAIKKYTNGSWESASYRKYGTETDAITTLPTTVIGDGTPISSYTIKGNTKLSGTPTPENPIMPSGCGEKTENLFDKDAKNTNNGYVNQAYLDKDNNEIGYQYFQISEYISVIPNETYVFYNVNVKADDPSICFYDNQKNFISGIRYDRLSTITATAPQNAAFVRVSFNDPMIVVVIQASTAPTSYIPYGYKLPLTLGSTTTNIYLGEVQSTRRIKKIVFDGTEPWEKNSGSTPTDYIYYLPNIGNVVNRYMLICDRLPVVTAMSANVAGIQFYSNKSTLLVNLTSAIMDAQTSGNTVTGLKEYLAAQYAAGTPVTVWYALAEPETAVVNEPLMKIDNYADSISVTNLATSGAAQELDVDTTLKPSELNLTYHGWHEHGDTKFTT